ncbi:MAG: hypothetical protein JWO38_7495 [Gemmataceae bacterium]|nr:hypothetical protein [Gemmataceae bacterium]
MNVVGLILALLLVALGAGTAHRQSLARRRLREERFLPSDERAYLRGQVIRRTLVAVVLAAIGGMIGWYYLSGMDDRMNEIADRRKGINPADEPGRPADPNPADQADKDFAKYVGVYWIGVLGLVFVVACLAVFDFWATRRYWMAQYKLIKADHETKLQRDLAVYRQAKDNDRLGRLRGKKPGDDAGEPPPAG